MDCREDTTRRGAPLSKPSAPRLQAGGRVVVAGRGREPIPSTVGRPPYEEVSATIAVDVGGERSVAQRAVSPLSNADLRCGVPVARLQTVPVALIRPPDHQIGQAVAVEIRQERIIQ